MKTPRRSIGARLRYPIRMMQKQLDAAL